MAGVLHGSIECPAFAERLGCHPHRIAEPGHLAKQNGRSLANLDMVGTRQHLAKAGSDGRLEDIHHREQGIALGIDDMRLGAGQQRVDEQLLQNAGNAAAAVLTGEAPNAFSTIELRHHCSHCIGVGAMHGIDGLLQRLQAHRLVLDAGRNTERIQGTASLGTGAHELALVLVVELDLSTELQSLDVGRAAGGNLFTQLQNSICRGVQHLTGAEDDLGPQDAARLALEHGADNVLLHIQVGGQSLQLIVRDGPAAGLLDERGIAVGSLSDDGLHIVRRGDGVEVRLMRGV